MIKNDYNTKVQGLKSSIVDGGPMREFTDNKKVWILVECADERWKLREVNIKMAQQKMKKIFEERPGLTQFAVTYTLDPFNKEPTNAEFLT